MSATVVVKTVPAQVLDVKTSGPLGQASAIFSRFNVIDLDGDVTVAGAIPDGTTAVVSPYNHSSVIGGMLPAGRATIRTDHEKAVAHVEFFMTTAHGRDAFEVVRELGALGQWSYAFKILEADRGPAPDGSGGTVQFLKALDVFEVSPVIRGAGIDTRTTEAKEREAIEAVRRIRGQFVGTPSTGQTTDAKERELEAVRQIRGQFLGNPGDGEAQALAVREHLRFLRNQLRVG